MGKRFDRALMRLRGSGIVAPKAREVSGRAERRTPGGSLESSRLAARCLNSRAFALLLLLTRRDGPQRPGRDGCHRFLLLVRGQILHQFAIRFLQLGICIELFHHAAADAFAALDFVDLLQH